MPRANRHHIPGQVWHITHRCHKNIYLALGLCAAGDAHFVGREGPIDKV